MKKVAKDIFKAIYEEKWLAIEYKNQSGQITNYWIGVRGINANKKSISVDGLNVSTLESGELTIYYHSIQNSNIIDGSYHQTNPNLIADLEEHPSKYAFIFQNTANLKLLDYYAQCNRLDTTPYRKDYALIEALDLDVIGRGEYFLTEQICY